MTTIRMTRAEWEAEGKRRFGDDMMTWRFVCPSCGHVQSANDYKAAGAPSTVYEYSQIVQHGWAAYEALRRCGFPGDDIGLLFSVDAHTTQPTVWLRLVQGTREFLVNIGQLDGRDAEDVMAEWRSFFDALVDDKAFDEDMLDQLYRAKLHALGGATALTMALLQKGFAIPKALDA